MNANDIPFIFLCIVSSNFFQATRAVLDQISIDDFHVCMDSASSSSLYTSFIYDPEPTLFWSFDTLSSWYLNFFTELHLTIIIVVTINIAGVLVFAYFWCPNHLSLASNSSSKNSSSKHHHKSGSSMKHSSSKKFSSKKCPHRGNNHKSKRQSSSSNGPPGSTNGKSQNVNNSWSSSNRSIMSSTKKHHRRKKRKSNGSSSNSGNSNGWRSSDTPNDDGVHNENGVNENDVEGDNFDDLDFTNLNCIQKFVVFIVYIAVNLFRFLKIVLSENFRALPETWRLEHLPDLKVALFGVCLLIYLAYYYQNQVMVVFIIIKMMFMFFE